MRSRQFPTGSPRHLLLVLNLSEVIRVALVLGDNIFYGTGLGDQLAANTQPEGGIVYAYHVSDPERYGVVEFDSEIMRFRLKKNP